VTMRRRDILFACLGWGGLLAGLVWALLTQFRWVRENKPIQVQRPVTGSGQPEPGFTSSTGIVGTIGDDTRAALARGLAKRKPSNPEPISPPASKRRGPRQPQAPAD
jgi:hypothetical protein